MLGSPFPLRTSALGTRRRVGGDTLHGLQSQQHLVRGNTMHCEIRKQPFARTLVVLLNLTVQHSRSIGPAISIRRCHTLQAAKPLQECHIHEKGEEVSATWSSVPARSHRLQSAT